MFHRWFRSQTNSSVTQQPLVLAYFSSGSSSSLPHGSAHCPRPCLHLLPLEPPERLEHHRTAPWVLPKTHQGAVSQAGANVPLPIFLAFLWDDFGLVLWSGISLLLGWIRHPLTRVWFLFHLNQEEQVRGFDLQPAEASFFGDPEHAANLCCHVHWGVLFLSHSRSGVLHTATMMNSMSARTLTVRLHGFEIWTWKAHPQDCATQTAQANRLRMSWRLVASTPTKGKPLTR